MEHKKLEQQIAAAKRKIAKDDQSLGVAKNNYSAKVVVDMISGLAVGAFLGYFVDIALGTSPLVLVVLMVLGPFVGLYIFYKDYSRELDKEELDKKNGRTNT